MTEQNSLNLPLPFTSGSLWTGNGTNIPSTNTLTAGSGINIDNTSIPGNIIISATTPEDIIWHDSISASQPIVAGNGYIIADHSLGIMLTLPSVINAGDVFAAQNPFATSGFILHLPNYPTQQIVYNGTTASNITTSVGGTSIFLRCFYSGTNQLLAISSTNGLPFSLS